MAIGVLLDIPAAQDSTSVNQSVRQPMGSQPAA